eukprot:XP_011683514.1 PREDICTED: uncharacterized protein LOC105447322 [Strongylocentrotus purpuratus]
MMHLCKLCPNGFTTKSSLHIHLENTHHIPLTDKCEYCDYEGASFGALKRHYTRKEERAASETRSCLFGKATVAYQEKIKKGEEKKRKRRNNREGKEIAVRERDLAVKCPKLTIKVPVQEVAPIKLTMAELQDVMIDRDSSMSSFGDLYEAHTRVSLITNQHCFMLHVIKD